MLFLDAVVDRDDQANVTMMMRAGLSMFGRVAVGFKSRQVHAVIRLHRTRVRMQKRRKKLHHDQQGQQKSAAQ